MALRKAGMWVRTISDNVLYQLNSDLITWETINLANTNDLNAILNRISILNTNVSSNTASITANTNSINTLNTNVSSNTASITALNSNFSNYYSKSEADARFSQLTTQNTILSLSGGGNFESGSTQNAILNWSVGRAAGTNISKPTDSISSIKINNISQTFTNPVIGASATGSYNAGSITSNQTITLQSTTIGSLTNSTSVSYNFALKRYIGFVASASPTDAILRNLSLDLTQSLNSSGGLTASGANYICFAFPLSFGSLSSIKIGGFAQTFNLTTRTVTNSNGVAALYNIYVSQFPTSANVDYETR